MVFLKWNGATFSAETYPKLAKVIPSLALVETRGEFIRVWDDGRGIDPERSLLSAQSDAIRNITGSVSGRYSRSSMKVFSNGSGALSAYKLGDETGAVMGSAIETTNLEDRWSRLDFDASKVVPVASENRPRNIAFNFLVRAK